MGGGTCILRSSTSAGNLTIIGNLQDIDRIDDILFVVYTERIIVDEGGKSEEVIRLISARLATSFERGVYYGKRSYSVVASIAGIGM